MSRTASPSRDVTDLTVERVNSNSASLSTQNLEEENAKLRKQLRQIEGEYKTSNAVLEQRIELLENQITGFQERETSMKKMNETIMLALNDMDGKDLNPGNKAAKELELATVHHNKEMQEYRARTNELIKNLETENKKFKEGMNENETRVKELTLHFEKAQLNFNQAVSDLDQERSVLESKVKRLEEEKFQHRELSDYEILVKTNELKMGNEREKEEHRKDLQKIKDVYDKSIQELKLTYENERRVMETKIEKLQEYISKEGNKKENMTPDLQAKYHKEIQQLKDTISQMKIDHVKEVEALKSQLDQANEKVEKLDSTSKKLKTALKNSQSLQEQNSKQLKEKLDKAKSVMEHGETLVEENKKYKQKITDLKTYIKKLEASEHNLKGMIQEKENRSTEDQNELKKIIQHHEQRKLSQSVHTSQNLQQRRQSALAVLPTEDNIGTGLGANRRDYPSILSNSTTTTNPVDLNSNQISQFSPPKQDTPPSNVEPVKIASSVSQRNERSVSPLSSSVTSKLPQERKSVVQTPNTTNRKTPLETSFADHGFNVEDALRTDTSRIDRINKAGKERTSDNKFSDVDSMPINYNEFIKRSQRSKKQADKTEDELEKSTNREQEPRIHHHDRQDDSAPQLFFTTTQDENQPLFGTSHFVFEGTQELQEEHEQEITPIRRKDERRRASRQNDDLDLERRILGFANDIDMEDIVEVGDGGDLGRVSANYNHRRGSLAKSYNMREDMDTRPSLMNPLHSVYDSATINDLFQDQQASVDLMPKSAVDREREKDKIFSSRCSLNVSSANRGNGSRQKIEGRLKDLEWKLKEMELKNQGLRVEKDKVQFEFEKLMVELKEKRAESEGMKKNTNEPWDEKKEEREVALKNEIKFLINKLLKVKNKLEKQSEELNVTKSSNILGQSQLNYSMNAYQQPQSKKDYSKEYGNLGSGLSNMVLTSQIKERENWNPANPQILQKSINSESWNGTSVLNTSSSKLENYRASERGSAKSSLGVAIENFAKNVRSKSNARYDHNRESQNQSNISLNYGAAQKQIESTSATTRTHRTKGPILPRPEDLGSGINREVLKPLTSQNYEISNSGSVNFENNSSYLYQRKYPR